MPAPLQRVDEPILPRSLLLWLAVLGLVLGLTALGIIWWADDAHDTAVARTMGFTTFALANILLAYVVKDPLRSVFSLDTLSDRRLLQVSALSLVVIVLSTELRILHRILDSVPLTGQQWLVCILGSATVLVASEIQKFVLRRRETA